MSTQRELSASERAMLDFERESWTFGAPKETSIRAKLGCSPTTYYRTIGAVIDTRAAYDYDPLTVARLRRQRDDRRRMRVEGRRADPGR
ncbi:MAG TPA: DUF3263 domain-containing protein [Acidimicrobiia bacterium]|jgi:hypothetical protein